MNKNPIKRYDLIMAGNETRFLKCLEFLIKITRLWNLVKRLNPYIRALNVFVFVCGRTKRFVLLAVLCNGVVFINRNHEHVYL